MMQTQGAAPKKLSPRHRLIGEFSCLSFPGMTWDKAQGEMTRIEEQLEADSNHLGPETEAFHKRDLPAAHRIGVNLEFIAEFRLYREAGFSSVVDYAEKKFKIKKSQVYLFCGIARAIPAAWLAGWGTGRGVKATGELVKLPEPVKESLFELVKDGHSFKLIHEGRLAAETALSLELELDDVVAWAIRAVLKQSTGKEEKEREKYKKSIGRKKGRGEGRAKARSSRSTVRPMWRRCCGSNWTGWKS